MLNREIQRSRYVRMRRTVDGAPVKQPLGISAVRGDVSAIIDL